MRSGTGLSHPATMTVDKSLPEGTSQSGEAGVLCFNESNVVNSR